MDPTAAAMGAAVVSNFIKLMVDYANSQSAPEWERPKLDSSVVENLRQQLETMLSPSEIQQRVGDVRSLIGDVNEKMVTNIVNQPYGSSVRQKNISNQITRGATQTEQTVNSMADQMRRENQNILQSVLGQRQNALRQQLGENVAARQVQLQNLAFERGTTGAGDVFAGLSQAIANAVSQYANVEQRNKQQELLNTLLQQAMQNANSPVNFSQNANNNDAFAALMNAISQLQTGAGSGQKSQQLWPELEDIGNNNNAAFAALMNAISQLQTGAGGSQGSQQSWPELEDTGTVNY